MPFRFLIKTYFCWYLLVTLAIRSLDNLIYNVLIVSAKNHIQINTLEYNDPCESGNSRRRHQQMEDIPGKRGLCVLLLSGDIYPSTLPPHEPSCSCAQSKTNKSLAGEKQICELPVAREKPVCSKSQSIFQGTGHYSTHLVMEPGRSW